MNPLPFADAAAIEALDIAETIGDSKVGSESHKLRQFMVNWCDLNRHCIPEPIHKQLTVARDAIGEQDVSAELKVATLACWDYLGSSSCAFYKPEVCAVWAVMCTLFDEADGHEAYDLLWHFFDFCKGGGYACSCGSRLVGYCVHEMRYNAL